jgi:hypothetical protein
MPAGGALTAAAVAGPVIGGILGGITASSGRKAQAAAAAAALAELNRIGMPPDISKEVIMQQFQSQGIMTPELEQDIHLAASQVGQISEDKGLRASQMDVLNTLGQQSRGGLNAGDRQAYNELRASTQRDAEAKRQQIMQQMQAQGQGSSGANLMAQLQSAQAAEDTQSAGGDRLAAEASRRALEALAQRGQMAGNVRSQDFSVNQARSAAEDQRNQFLFQNSASQQSRNVAAQNQAQAANLAARQNIANANVGQANTESQRQNEAKRTYYNDQLNLASAKANALNNQGTALANQAQGQANMYSGIGSALGQGAATYANYAAKQPAQKLDANGNPIT